MISSTDFESGLGPFSLGGADAARVSGGYASSGTYSIQLRDNSFAASSLVTTTSMNLPGQTMLRVQWSEITSSMETGEDYYVELNIDGGGWLAIGEFVSGLDFSNGVRHARDLQVALSGTTNINLRFRCDAFSNDDQVYIDDVVISAQ